jgi:hypothetical protein
MSYLRYMCLVGQLKVKTNRTNTYNVNKTWALLQSTEELIVGGRISYLCYLWLFG